MEIGLPLISWRVVGHFAGVKIGLFRLSPTAPRPAAIVSEKQCCDPYTIVLGCSQCESSAVAVYLIDRPEAAGTEKELRTIGLMDPPDAQRNGEAVPTAQHGQRKTMRKIDVSGGVRVSCFASPSRGGVRKPACLAAISLFSIATTVLAEDLIRGFTNPPDSARPWVYWMWLEGTFPATGLPPAWRR